jgi:hypothetical protein
MFRHYRVVFREFVFITWPSYISISIAAVGNTITCRSVIIYKLIVIVLLLVILRKKLTAMFCRIFYVLCGGNVVCFRLEVKECCTVMLIRA